MKKLLLAVVCSTSLLSIARAEDGGTGTGDAMHSQEAMAPDGAQAPRTKAKQTKKQEKKPAADPKAKHDGMDRAMEHGAGMDRGSTQQGGQMSGGMK